MTTLQKEPIPVTPLKWGQVALMLLAAALCAVFEPVYLVYAGLLRCLWCTVGGHLGRGLLSLLAFVAVYLVVLLGTDDPDPWEESQPPVASTAPSQPSPPPGFSSAVYVPVRDLPR